MIYEISMALISPEKLESKVNVALAMLIAS
jgi:hypothetical protein